MNYTQGKCYLVSLQPPNERLEFQFLPQEIKVNRGIKAGQIDVVGRNTPKYHVTGGDKTIQFELDFYAEDEQRLEVMQKLEWLESLTFNNGKKSDKGVERVKLVFGDMFKDEVWFLTAFSYTARGFSPDHNYMPYFAKASITLALDTQKDRLKDDVKWRQS